MSQYKYLVGVRVIFTCSNVDQTGSSIEGTGSCVKDNRGTAVSEGCVNTPVTIRRISLRNGSASRDEHRISSIILLRTLTNT
jgi:hypothetical protein